VGEIPEQVARELYVVPPRRFVERRDAAAARARAAGDPQLARAIARLRRPTVAAWLVNLLAHHRPDLVSELSDLAEALQDAQRKLHGGTLRDLTAQRRKVVSALVRTAESLAREADPDGRAALPLAEVEATLGAALADPQVAAQVRAGRLERPVSYTGFGAPATAARGGGGSADRTRGTATAPDRGRAAGPQRAREEELRRAREEELRQAAAAAAAAAAERDRAGAARRALADELADIDRALAELAGRRAEVAARLGEAEAAERTARRAAERAARRLAALEADRG
jgi:hypothetical protein